MTITETSEKIISCNETSGQTSIKNKISKDEIAAVIGYYKKDRRYALAAMQDMQRKYNYVPREGLEALAAYVGCPLAEIYAMATFYKALNLKPKGKHIIKVCDGTACHIRGSVNLISGIYRILGIMPDETTQYGIFSLELVNCLGACALAPVMVIDDTYHGNVKMETLPEIFNNLANSSNESFSVEAELDKSSNEACSIEAELGKKVDKINNAEKESGEGADNHE